ncbi:hypothetical protein ACS0TY_024444 [Phlomoides rotata]
MAVDPNTGVSMYESDEIIKNLVGKHGDGPIDVVSWPINCKSWVVLIVSTTLMLPIFIFATPILKALGQDEIIAEEVGRIALWFIPVIYSFIFSFTCQMFLQAQSKNMIISYLAAFSLLIHIFLSWLLTVKYKYGITGAMVSTILAYWIPNIGQIIFIVSGGCHETWKGFSMLAFQDLWAHLAHIFTNDHAVAVEVSHLSLFSILMNSIQPVLSVLTQPGQLQLQENTKQNGSGNAFKLAAPICTTMHDHRDFV